jgi:hypothetical protein
VNRMMVIMILFYGLCYLLAETETELLWES